MTEPGKADLLRSRAFGWAGIVGPLVLGLGFALILAYQALDAARGHRAAAQATVRDHAEFAAYLLASRVERRLTRAMLYGFYPVELAFGRTARSLPNPATLRDSIELARCAAVVDPADRLFFRLDLDNGDLAVDGNADTDFRIWLTDSLAAHAQNTYGENWQFAHLFGPLRGERKPISYRVWRRDERNLVYGFDSCWRDGTGNVFDQVLGESGVLPPTLVGATPNDSLFTLSVLDAAGEPVYGQPAASDGSFYGSAALRPPGTFEGLQLRVALRPMAAEQLVIGGLPKSRLPVALGLVLLTATLMAVALAQLRRGQELVRLRERFIGNVSHELRTPLQQILLFVDLLRLRHVRSAEERNRALRVIDQEVRRLTVLVENILEFSRFSKREALVSPQTVELRDLVEATVQSFRILAEAKDSTVEFTAESGPTVRADPNAIHRIIVNLLDNAVKYGPSGQTVRVSVFQTDSRGCVAVEDEGPGIPPPDRRKIWESFYRLEREERQARTGSGIGLAIVRQLATEMGGGVRVEAGAGGGARFLVWLPATDGGRSDDGVDHARSGSPTEGAVDAR